MYWFTLSWWKYLLAERSGYSGSSLWNTFWCRAKGHPDGIVWYNPGGDEPDYHCKNCGDYLG